MTVRASNTEIQVGISIYQQELQHIQQCLKSCLEQQGVTTLVTARIDGTEGANAETRGWLREVARKMDNFELIEGETNLGTFGSYETIFSTSQSTYLCQLDADDYLSPGALSVTKTAIDKSPKASFAYTQCISIDQEGIPFGLGHRQATPFSMENLLLNFITFHLRLIRRTSYEKTGGYNPSLQFTGDYDLSLKLSEVGDVVFIDRPLYYYRLHSNSASQTYTSKLQQEVAQICNEALARRQLSDTYQIRVDENGQTQLLSKAEERKALDQQQSNSYEIFYISPKEMHNNQSI